MNMDGVSIIGWFHSLACIVSILVGAFVLAGRKGTPLHRSAGRWYVYAMIAANLASFGVYHFDIARFVPFVGGRGIFGLFHWESVFTLSALLLGWFAATRQRHAVWAYLHPALMLTTYYMLMGGLVNEVLVRVPAVRAFAQSQAPAVRNVAQTPLAGMVQGSVMLIYVVLLILFMFEVARHRKRARNAAA